MVTPVNTLQQQSYLLTEAMKLPLVDQERELSGLLTCQDFNVDGTDAEGNTILHLAIQQGNIQVLTRALDKEADPNVQNRNEYTPLMLASRLNSLAMVRILLTHPNSTNRIEVNSVFASSHDTPLHVACSWGFFEIVQELLKYGADPRILHQDSWTAQAMAKGSGFDSIANLMPYDPYTEELLARKMLAHFHSIPGVSTIQGTQFPLEGLYSPIMHKQLASVLREYFTFQQNSVLSKEEQEDLLTALMSAAILKQPQEILNYVQSHNLTILAVGWYGHTLDLVFYGDCLAICNRGQGSATNQTIQRFKIDKSKISLWVIERICAQREEIPIDAIAFFYEKLPVILSQHGFAEQDPAWEFLKPWNPKRCKIGICALACAKAAIRYVYICLAGENNPRTPRSWIAKMATQETKMISLFARLCCVRDYFKLHTASFPIPRDLDLVEKCLQKTTQKTQLVPKGLSRRCTML